MAGPIWKNLYDLSQEQINMLDEAESHMELMRINDAENILMSMLEDDSECIPVLNNLGHLYGRYLSDFDAPRSRR